MVEVESRIGKRAAGATKPDLLTTKGIISKYAYWLEKEGYRSSEYINLAKRLAKLGANLLDPEDVKKTIGRQPWKNGSKMLAVYAYDGIAKMLKIDWSSPKYVQEENLPFVPDETELDQLIAGCRSRRMATFLQTLKETFADPSEVLRLRWIDVSGNIITINDPVKRHNPRQLKVSNKLITMLNALPRTSERIFPTKYDSMQSSFVKVRKRVAGVLENPRINAISFNTYRHWGATMTFHYTKNLLLVQKLLGHKSIKNTVKYTHLVHFKDDEFDVATATTVEEAKDLAATGFDYFTTMNGIQIFRKPKILQKYRY